jgi:hypothetical protein
MPKIAELSQIQKTVVGKGVRLSGSWNQVLSKGGVETIRERGVRSQGW